MQGRIFRNDGDKDNFVKYQKLKRIPGHEMSCLLQLSFSDRNDAIINRKSQHVLHHLQNLPRKHSIVQCKFCSKTAKRSAESIKQVHISLNGLRNSSSRVKIIRSENYFYLKSSSTCQWVGRSNYRSVWITVRSHVI